MKPANPNPDPSEAHTKSPETPSLFILLIGFAVVLLLWVAWPLVARYWLGLPGVDTKLADTAQLGDTFGAINTLFSGLALAALLYAAHLQRHEIKLLKEEQAANRHVMQRQQAEMEAQALALRAQVDDSMFALLMGMLEQKLGALEYRQITPGAPPIKDAKVAHRIQGEIIDQEARAQNNHTEPSEIQRAAFMSGIARHLELLTPWVSVLLQVLTWIDEKPSERRRYCGVVRIAHGDDQLRLLARWANFYNERNSRYGELKVLMERCSLFAYAPIAAPMPNDPVLRTFHPSIFDPEQRVPGPNG